MNAPDRNEVLEKNNLVPFNLADFYKTGHPSMYPKATTKLVANFTPRSAKYAPVLRELFDDKVVWFGLQGFIQEFLIDLFGNEFFRKPKAQAVRKYKRRMDTALGPDAVPVSNLERLHDLGYLPLEIRSLPEGSRVDIKVPPVIFINTHPDFPWVSTYFETVVSCESWKPSTVATIAFEFRKLLTYFANLTGAPLDFVNWQGHDFSMRGMSGVHDAMRCGAGHLLSFTGTDTIPAIDYLEDHYGADADRELVGGSIPASEHSVMALRILLTLQRLERDPAHAALEPKALRRQAELEVVREFVTQGYPQGMVSIVSDTFDFWNVMTVVAKELKADILARKPDALGNAKVVFRPDSGDPVKILTGYTDEELLHSNGTLAVSEAGKYTVKATGESISEAERTGAVQCLWNIYGGTTTAKGYKVLDSHVGLIYGDSITLPRARDIMLRLAAKGFASCNVVLGIGSYVYGMNSRDTFGYALKAIYAEVGGEAVDIYKDPATDDGTKKSAKGLLRVEKEGDRFVLYEQQTVEQAEGGALVPVFRDGELLVTQSLAEIRERLQSSWVCPEPGSISWA
ncbi:nicotinate phosphoribosyltransferase [Paraburkholderia sp. SEWSISQ10-3 4]|uniref:nicotinate phosphoribosyltransferase n=1 Tax=Paraburkholderia TaxID=1822464 RepID=UPI00224F03F9|nr:MULTISPECIES: nicotinate phosphoribosyltransferase [Paraburkholderia]MCX4138851.1 nicotinate phosphoribosyltransferase [Paraburkholderia aspalathi]MDN7171541.1 nicotinate phosphoribosyltransferase [Paraburkholderia sp. SEWSISQ10-3 4]MDQ6501180.1 nicotinate phosphoribosyltransferase [Paraburkholderia aspalathi]